MSAPRDPNLIDEQSFEDYLKRGSPTSQRYRQASDDEPPAALDQRVLDMARAAVEKSTPRAAPSKSRPTWMRWSAPLALAASAVLVLSIVIESGVQRESATLTAPTAERATQAPRAPQAQSVPEPALHDHAEYERVYAAPAEAQVELAADAANEARVEATGAAPSREEKAARRAPVEDATEPQFAPPPPAAPAAASGPRNTVRGLAASAADEVAREETAARAPEEWLADIRELRRAGRSDEADREWEEFRRAYPSFPVDASDPAQRVEPAGR